MLLGKERTGFRATDDEWRAVAVHEAGHALAGLIFHAEDGLHKVTIQPRGQAMGVAHFSPGEMVLHTRRYLEGQICKGLGGRAAEEIVFGHDAVTSGAKADLQHTTRVAREMVYKLGMGPNTGLVAFDERESGGAVSAELHAAMDRDVRLIVELMYTRVREAIEGHRARAGGAGRGAARSGDAGRQRRAVHSPVPRCLDGGSRPAACRGRPASAPSAARA